jgi:hypothetical protein
MTQPLLAHDLPRSERNLKNRIVAISKQKKGRDFFCINVAFS